MTDMPKCGTKKRQGTGTCAQPAGWGTNHLGDGPCRLHGGALQTVAAASKRRLIEHNVAGQLHAKGWDGMTDPVAAYADMVGELWAFKEVCRERVATLQSWTSTNFQGGEEIKAEIAVYERAQDRAAKGLVDMLKLGLSAETLRQAKEAPARRLAERFNRILEDVFAGLELTAEQRAKVPGLLSTAVGKQ